MGNKTILKNNLKNLDNEELAQQLELEANKKMLWGFQKDRTKKIEKEKPKEEKPKE